jgi:hypothetical protein
MPNFKKLIKIYFIECLKYSFNFIFIIHKDIKQFNTVFATNNGLFISNKTNNKVIKALHGLFYGIALKQRILFVYLVNIKSSALSFKASFHLIFKLSKI